MLGSEVVVLFGEGLGVQAGLLKGICCRRQGLRAEGMPTPNLISASCLRFDDVGSQSLVPATMPLPCSHGLFFL